MVAAKKKTAKKAPTKPRLLSGGNPQIAKGYGDAPIKAYIAAVPDWRRDVVKRMDAIITRAVPGVKKAVKWNSPLYGMEEGLWFLSVHVYARYVKVTFFKGASLKPPPEGKSKYPQIRHYDVHEGQLDEKQFAAWIKQASKLPGEKM
ncbi:MAG TPA: DUF1801 domain-containing protein [Candidatus Binatia bacterium]|nr:DUF1801 domain-containing protein [Candidatus Binatia bacterium]